MARSVVIAGDPGGVSVRRRESSRRAVCFTVNVCLKSSGNEICPGSRFKSCQLKEKKTKTKFNIAIQYSLAYINTVHTFSLLLLNLPRRFLGVGVFCVFII